MSHFQKKVLKKRKKKNKKDAAAAEMDENLGMEVKFLNFNGFFILNGDFFLKVAGKKKKNKIVEPAEDDSELVANGEVNFLIF